MCWAMYITWWKCSKNLYSICEQVRADFGKISILDSDTSSL